jgi:hypothetical protein
VKIAPTAKRRPYRVTDDDPWMDGYRARQAGLARSANPYFHGVDHWQLWNDGWLDAHVATEIIHCPAISAKNFAHLPRRAVRIV